MATATKHRWRTFATSALLAAPSLAADPPAAEPSIVEVQQAAARVAGGEASEDQSRLSRARAAHWAPVLRGLIGGKSNELSRIGTYRGAPVQLTDLGSSLSWGVSATWDLPQVIYSRDEAQLGHAQLHLAKARLQAATEAARLYLDRREKRRTLATLIDAAGSARSRLLLEILRLTAELDARTGGLFRASLEGEAAESSRALDAPAAPAQPAPAEKYPPPVLLLAPEKR